uniref:Ig-like domain-containing protein n=1 Tax=Anabas testudineus TaxID=64144 RepID=A0A7N6BUS9_ANATE
YCIQVWPHCSLVTGQHVKKGDSITVPCLYDSKYINNVKYLCKGYSWSSCSYAVRTDQPHSSRKFSISDDKIKRIFTVTIKDARDKDTGYYWCAVEINDGSDIREYFHLSVNRVHLTVTEKPSTSKYNDIKVVCNKCISHICSDLLFVMFFIATHTTTCLTTLSDTPDPSDLRVLEMHRL